MPTRQTAFFGIVKRVKVEATETPGRDVRRILTNVSVLWMTVCVVLVLPRSIRAEDVRPKPILWFNFADMRDEVCRDKSGHGNDGRVYGAKSVKGELGPALRFDGIDDFIALPPIPFHGLPGVTVEAWIKISTRRRQPILGYGVDTIRLNVDNGKAGLSIRAGPCKGAGDPEQLSLGKYHHVVGTYDKKKVCLYVDGVLKQPTKHSGGIRNDDSIGARIGSSLGWPSQTWDYYFQGEIAEIKIYNQALADKQINAAWKAGRSR